MSTVPARATWAETKDDEPLTPNAPAVMPDPSSDGTQTKADVAEDDAVVEVSSPRVIRSSRLQRDGSAEEAELLTPTLPRWVETEPRRDRFSPIGISVNQPIFLPMCPSCLRRVDGNPQLRMPSALSWFLIAFVICSQADLQDCL